MLPEVPPFRTKTIRLLEGDRFTFTVDSRGMYVDWPNLYCVVSLRSSSLSLRAMENRMRAVCQFHNWAAERGIDVNKQVESLSFFSKEQITALRNELRVNLLTRHKPQRRSAGGPHKPGRQTVTNSQWLARCASVRDYVSWHAEHAIQRMSSRDERLPEARERLKDFRGWMTEKIRVRKSMPREGLGEDEQAVFLRAITPGDPTNPFSERHQHRNYALWLTYFDGGIRRSEALGLKGEDLSLRGSDPKLIVHRRPDDLDEKRLVAPNTKTRPHPVSLTERLCQAMHTYMVKYRPKYRGAKRSPYVFFGQMRKPLSVKTIHYMCEKLRTVPGMSADFTTHLLRYDWNDRFGDAAEELGLSADHEQQVRNLHQGWTETSQQGQQYQNRRNRKRGQRIGLAMQDASTKGAA
jgi:integrase